MSKKEKKESPITTSITAYKGFDKNWKCLDYQYEVGKTYTHEGPAKLCSTGFHACESPLDILNYYSINDGANFAQVDLAGVTDEKENDSKRVGSSITIKAALTLPMLISAQFEWTFNKAKEADKASGNYSKAASSGSYSKAASSGDSSNAASSGDYSTAASSGDSSTAASSGDSSKAASSGYSSTAAAKGEKTVAMVAGCNGTACAGNKGAFALAWFDEKNDCMRIAVGIVGENGIKSDVFYKCDGAGKLIVA